MLNDKNLHTVTLDKDKCKGCVTCMKRCPVEAIRVRNGKASVLYDRCIGCGECVRICPHHAKQATYDDFDTIKKFKYKIAIPAPSIYGQFDNITDLNLIPTALQQIGFDEIYDVGAGAELVSEATKIVFDQEKIPRPVISTACPAVLELIYVRFKHFVPHLLNLLAPADITAKLAREKAINRGIPAEDIGVFFLSPCPAKVYALKNGLGLKAPTVDGVLAISDIYKRIQPIVGKIEVPKDLSKLGSVGLSWASSGGEAAAVYTGKYLAADGIENVISVLNSLEDNNLKNIEFIELNACTSGCVGGVLNVENPFVAKARHRELRRKMPYKKNKLVDEGKPLEFFKWEKEPNYEDVLRLDDDRTIAMQKLIEMENILKTLPQTDCGLCGAPSCKAFAEDIVKGVIPKNSKCKYKDE